MNLHKLLLLVVLAGMFVQAISLSSLSEQEDDLTPADTLSENKQRHLSRLREALKGRLQKPADSVFQNIKVFKGVPAGRLLAIMDIGYSQSLGVGCAHCHNTGDWASDEKPQKQVAREMNALVADVRGKLKQIKGLRSEDPVVNCTTCHRGALKPALNLN